MSFFNGEYTLIFLFYQNFIDARRFDASVNLIYRLQIDFNY